MLGQGSFGLCQLRKREPLISDQGYFAANAVASWLERL
jgi:hypothetical protein